MYLDGVGVPKDAVRARGLFEDAISRGNIFARRTLGLNLMKRTFGRREIAKGLFLFGSALFIGVRTALRDPIVCDCDRHCLV
jgi:TPR repeat protein